jgi:hypothetical protein
MSKSIITVVYSHGRFGSPWYGSKIEALRPIALKKGLNIISIRYPEEDSVEEMEERLVNLVADDVSVPGDLIFLSSSRGAYVSTRISQRIVDLFGGEDVRKDDDIVLPPRHLLGSFLIAPAFYIKPEYYPDQDPMPADVPMALVHGFDDTVIDVENSITFARKHQAQLFLLPGGHRMNSQIGSLCVLFDMFLDSSIQASDDMYMNWRLANPDTRRTADDASPHAASL